MLSLVVVDCGMEDGRPLCRSQFIYSFIHSCIHLFTRTRRVLSYTEFSRVRKIFHTNRRITWRVWRAATV